MTDLFALLTNLNFIFSVSVFGGMLVGGLVTGYIIYRVLKLLFEPGIVRAVLGAFFAAIIFANLYGLLRAFFGAGVLPGIGPFGAYVPAQIYKAIYEFLSSQIVPVISDLDAQKVAIGAYYVFFGFGSAFGFIWGIGSFNPKLSEHGTEHAAESEVAVKRQNPIVGTIHFLRSPGVQGFAGTLGALIRPLVTVLAVCAIALVVVMALFSNPFAPHVVQTAKANASAITVEGLINLPINNPDGSPVQVNKTVFFVGLVVVVLAILGGFAIGLALLMNWLGREVKEAKAQPNEPLKEEPFLFRIIDFIFSWIADILSVTSKTLSR